jgi:PAS domain-containing protein
MSSPDIHLMLKAKVGALSYVGGINLFDSEGMLINSSGVWPVPAINVADRPYFKAFKSDPKSPAVLVEAVHSRVTGAWTTVIARKVTGPNGEFLGAIGRGVEPANFEKFFASLALGDDAAISMFHRDGTLLARYPHLETMIGQNFADGPFFQILSEADRGTLRLTSPVDDRDRLGSAHLLSNFPIVVIATRTVSAALADWRAQIRFLIAVAGLSVLVIAAMLFLIVRKLSQQHRLSQQRLRLEKQRLDTAVNNMTQGLLLFDSSQRLVVCNQRYIEMYGLSAEVLKPGCTFREVIAHRKDTGSFVGDEKEYCTLVLRDIEQRKVNIIETPRRTFNPDCERTVGGWRMGRDPRGYHRAQTRRTADHAPCALRCANRPAEPRIVSRPAETGTGWHCSGRAFGGALHRHR